MYCLSVNHVRIKIHMVFDDVYEAMYFDTTPV